LSTTISLGVQGKESSDLKQLQRPLSLLFTALTGESGIVVRPGLEEAWLALLSVFLADQGLETPDVYGVLLVYEG